MEDKIEMSIEDVILNIKMIAKIKQNEKMIVQNKVLNVDTRTIPAFQRWWTADSRHDTISFIITVINNSFDYLHEENKDPVYDKTTVVKELTACIPGLDNLSATYKLDNLLVAKIDIVKEKIVKFCQ